MNEKVERLSVVGRTGTLSFSPCPVCNNWLVWKEGETPKCEGCSTEFSLGEESRGKLRKVEESRGK